MSTQIISLDPTYTFTVTGNRTLKAVFASVAPQEYAYTGNVVSATLYPGVYKLEAWGAEGGYRSGASYAGKGGYSVGTLTLTETTAVFVRAGGSGNTGGAAGGFNGGGRRSTYNGGGGASDIRIGVDDYNHRVIVAGGGGSDGAANKAGGYGGGTTGQSRTDNYGSGGFGGTQTGVSNSSWQTSAPSTNTTAQAGAYAGFGFGGNGITANGGNGGAGGGGWYGGSGSMPDSSSDDDRGGAGGSGFVWTGANAPTGFGLTEANYLTNAQTKDGSQSFTSPTGTTETGHSGNGYVRITPVAFYVVTVVSEDTTKGTVSGGGQYENGTQATVTASPTSGYKLSGWYEGETQVSTDNSYTFTVSGNRTLTARFVEAAVYTITATIDPSGSGTVTGAGQYQEGATVTLVATAGDGYEFSGWQEGGQTVSTGATYTFTATQDRALTAQFTAVPSFNPTWTQGTLPTSGTWVDMCYAAGKFVLLGNMGVLLYSSSGAEWANSGQGQLTNAFAKVAYCGDRFCAYDSQTTRHSTNAINWVTDTSSLGAILRTAVAYGPSGVVTVGNYRTTASYYYYSSNGYSQKSNGTLPVYSTYNDMVYIDGKYVLLAKNSNTGLYYTWGGSWITFTIPVQGVWDNIVRGDDRVVAVSNSSTNKAMYSLDGVTWVESTMPVTATWNALAYGDGVFVALAANSDIVAYTKDGATWRLAENKLPSAITAQAFGYGNGRFVAAYGQTIVYT